MKDNLIEELIEKFEEHFPILTVPLKHGGYDAVPYIKEFIREKFPAYAEKITNKVFEDEATYRDNSWRGKLPS